MALIDTAALISISEANKLGISSLIRQAEAGQEQVVLRNNKPVAVVMGMQRFEQLTQLQDDIVDITLTAARMLTTTSRRRSLDDVLAQFGYTREQLRGPDR